MKGEKLISAFDIPSLALDVFSSKWKRYIFLAGINIIPNIILVPGGGLLLPTEIYQEASLYKLIREYSIQSVVAFILFVILQLFTYTLTSTAIFILTKEQGATIRQTISQALKMFFPILATGIIAFIIVLGGYVLLIIPGIILTVWYTYALPCVIDGDRGVKALSNSKSLVKGRFWKTLTGILVPSLAFSILGHVMQLPFDLAGEFLKSKPVSYLFVASVLLAGEFVKTVVVVPLITISLYILYKSAKETYIQKS